MLKFVIYIFIITSFIVSCTNSESKDVSLNTDEKPVCHLLIFKQEKKAELWINDNKNTFSDSFKINIPQNIPIGEFGLTFDKTSKKLEIHFPNDFYKSKGNQKAMTQNFDLGNDNFSPHFFTKLENIHLSKIIIFPNDNRFGGQFVPGFAAPHWMAELYAFLNLKKKEYI